MTICIHEWIIGIHNCIIPAKGSTGIDLGRKPFAEPKVVWLFLQLHSDLMNWILSNYIWLVLMSICEGTYNFSGTILYGRKHRKTAERDTPSVSLQEAVLAVLFLLHL